jgi:siroheme synthase
VVRLKGGDPAIFGRLDEELEAARAAGFEPVIVPGVTSASGAAAALGLSLTRRRLAPRVQFVTAHGADGGLPPGLELDALADPAATTCVYMGRRTLPLLAAALMARGMPGDTAVRIVLDATRPTMESVVTTLHDAGAVAATLRTDAPCLLMIGAAMAETGGSAGLHARQPRHRLDDARLVHIGEGKAQMAVLPGAEIGAR